tara:strand:- start:14 stop:1384 length:1371 start_codon:yes stop_codon:yes gene_type:complete
MNKFNKYIFQYYFLVVLCFFTVNIIVAQDHILTKSEAIKLALESNFGIQMATNDIKIAENNAAVLNSGYLPTLSATAGADYSKTNSNFEYPGQFLDGGEPRPDAEINGAEARRYNSGLNLSYTLFDGLGRHYNYKRLKEQYKLSELQARETIENTLLQLFSVYYEIARLEENQQVLIGTLQISSQRVIRAEYAFEYGQNSKLDILNAQVDLTNDSINVLNNNLQLSNAKRDLNVVLNQDLDTNFRADTIVSFLPRLAFKSYVENALVNNVSLQQAESNLTINDYDVKVSKSGYLPSLDLTGSYGWNYNQSAPSAFFGGTNTKSSALGLGASLSWNLFDGGSTSTRIKNAKILYKNQELAIKQIALQTNANVENALAAYDNRLRIYEIQEQNVKTNQNNFERSTEQFQLGRISSIEFRQAQINLLNAETNKNLAKYDAKLAELQLLQLTGQLLNVAF